MFSTFVRVRIHKVLRILVLAKINCQYFFGLLSFKLRKCTVFEDWRKEGVGMGNRLRFPMPLAKIRISEGHDTASNFALDEVIISLVDLGERIFPGEKFVEL
jgi:hypothetical protein